MFRPIVVGWFLALRQLRRSSVWTTLLIMFIMTLTFLNLVVVGGILIGLPVGASLSYNQQYSGDVLLRAFPNKKYIERSEEIINTIKSFHEVKAISARYIEGGRAESNYQTRVGPKQDPDAVTAPIVGIDPESEELVTSIGSRMLEGEMLNPTEEGYVLVGKNLVDKYTLGAGVISATTLRGVGSGSKIRVSVNGAVKEMTIKGIMSSKAGEVSTRIMMKDSELRRMIGRTDRNVDEIAVRLTPGANAEEVVGALKRLGFGEFARVETARQSQGTFLDDIERTFKALSAFIGAIGLLVASITVFIVIFINAVTRRKYIGILKGIGISGSAIEWSYVFQSIVYALVGSAIGLMVVYTFLVPYFLKHPLNFPFADGVLLAPWDGTLLRAVALIVITMIAGYLPARMIVSRNTLDAILGR